MWEAVPSGDLFLDALSAAYFNAIHVQWRRAGVSSPLLPCRGWAGFPDGLVRTGVRAKPSGV